MDDHSVLTSDTGNTTCDIFKGAIGDTNQIVRGEVNLLQIDFHHMLIAYSSGSDNELDVMITNGQRGIEAPMVEFEVIIIIGDKAGLGRRLDIFVCLFRGDIGKDEVEEGHEYAMTLTIFQLVFPNHGDIGIMPIADKDILSLLGTAIEDAQYVPMFVRVRDVLYRHPSF